MKNRTRFAVVIIALFSMALVVFALTGSTPTRTINMVNTTTTLISSANPSVSGQSVTFTATVLPSTATGTVTFTIDGTTQPAVTISSGKAILAAATLSAGIHSVMAQYSGSSNFNTSTSSTLTLKVNHVNNSTSSTQTQIVNMTNTSTSLTSSANPSVSGQSVTFTATVLPSTATGTVTFTIDGVALQAIELASGHATLFSSTLTVGTHQISAQYSGDTIFATSTSSTLTQTVGSVTNATPPTVTAYPPGGTYNSMQLVNLTASEPATIYYTIDGSTPSTESPVYSSAIHISSTTTLKFFARDLVGNSGMINTLQYSISMQPKPFSVFIFNGNVENQTSLIPLFKKLTSSNDFIVPVFRDNPADYNQVPVGNSILNIGKLADTQAAIAKAKSRNVTYLMYDLEPPAGPEFYDYVNSTATVANQVHAAGLKLFLTPRWLEIPKYGTQIAPYADILTMQLPYPPNNLSGGYVDYVSKHSSAIRNAAGHPILIGEQLLAIGKGDPPTNEYDPKDIALEYNDTKQYIDYIQLYYFKESFTDNTNTTTTKDVIPFITKFYKEIGMTGIP